MVVGSSMDQIFMVMDYYQLDLSACLRKRKQPFSTSEVIIYTRMSAHNSNSADDTVR
jgi:hypothetical protein